MLKRTYLFLFLGAICLFIFQLITLNNSNLISLNDYLGLFAALMLIFIFGRALKRTKGNS